jgi:hypothetical protein
MSELTIRYSGFYGKIIGFSMPDWPEAVLEISPPTGGTHLMVISDHSAYMDLRVPARNAVIVAALRKEGIACPDDILDKWPYLFRGNFE